MRSVYALQLGLSLPLLSMSKANRTSRWLRGVCAASLLCASGVSSAYTLSFDPANQSVGLSASATVAVRIGGVLPDGLSAYDFNVTYDPAILSFSSAIDGLGLGIAFGLGATPGTGSVTVSDFSLESIADLLALQSNEFTLFSLVFDTAAAGTSALSLDLVTLGDAAGNRVAPSGLGTGSITVTAVPEPSSLMLLLAAVLAGTAPACRRRRESGH